MHPLSEPRTRRGTLTPAGLAAVAALAVCVVLAACDEGGGTLGIGTNPSDTVTTREEPLLTFLVPDAEAPTIANPVVEFYAVRGRATEAVMYYSPRPGRADSTAFVRLHLGAQSLDRLPDSTVVADGDSAQLTITLADPRRLIVRLGPSDLTFAAGQPGELRITYLEGDDTLDDATRQALAVWRQQPPPSSLWDRLTSTVSLEAGEVVAPVTGTGSYGVAY